MISADTYTFQKCAFSFYLCATYSARNCVLVEIKRVDKFTRTHLVDHADALSFYANAINFCILAHYKNNDEIFRIKIGLLSDNVLYFNIVSRAEIIE